MSGTLTVTVTTKLASSRPAPTRANGERSVATWVEHGSGRGGPAEEERHEGRPDRLFVDGPHGGGGRRMVAPVKGGEHHRGEGQVHTEARGRCRRDGQS